MHSSSISRSSSSDSFSSALAVDSDAESDWSASPRPCIDVKKILLESNSSLPKKHSWLKRSVTILFAPVLFPLHLIRKLFCHIAASQCIGTQEESRIIDNNKREQLLKIGGKYIAFGFDEGPVLEGMFFKNEHPNEQPKTILICAGSHGSYEQHAVLPMVKAVLSMGHNVMLFNYEGFGKSEGSISEKAVYRSVEAAYQYLIQKKQCEDSDIVGIGYSLGCGPITELALKHENISIVLDRGFTSMRKVAHDSAPTGLKSVAWMICSVGARFDNLNKLDKIKGNILIAQGKHDTKMASHAPLLYQAISENQDATFIQVNSKHQHTEDSVWFTKGKGYKELQKFFDKR